MIRTKPGACALGAGVLSLVLASCGGGGGGGKTTYTIGGSISGLTASGLTLADGSQTVSPAASATSFTFPDAVASGTGYSVTVSDQPSGETCIVSNGSGTAAANVTSVQVTCAANNLSGTAATGSAIAGATVTLVDSKGAQVTAKTDGNGNYSLSTAGMTAPFMVKVVTASASPNGYASGTTFYSVSDQATPSVIDVTPLTDLIIRDWYAAQSPAVSIDTAFANPAANPPPSVAEVQLIQTVVLDIVQPLLQQNGVNPVGLDLISDSFSANGQGVDAALDQIKPITYNSSGTTASVIIDTTSTTTQTTTVTASAGSTQVSTTTTNAATGAQSSIVTSAAVPASSAEAAALAGAQATLTGIANVVNSKGTALQASDITPYLDPDFLDGGETAAAQAQQIAQRMAGAIINALTVTQITSYDSTNDLIGIVGTVDYTLNGVTGEQTLGNGPEVGMIFKEESNGSWLLYGDQQQEEANAFIESVMDNNIDGTTWSGQVLQLQVSAPAASTATPCGSGYAGSVTAFPATAISGTSGPNGTAVTIGTGGYALQEDTIVYQSSGMYVCQFDALVNSLFVLPSGSLAGVVGDAVGFSIDGGSQTPALASTIPGYTTETINFTNLSGHALSSLTLGQSMTFQWTLPVTFPIYKVEIVGLVYVANGSSYVNCNIEPTTPLAVTSTSVSLTLPTTCNGSPIVSIPQTQPEPYAVQITVEVQGAHGEIASAWWPFN